MELRLQAWRAMLIPNPQTHAVIGAAIEVHRNVGPGLFESAYEEALACEFDIRQIPFARQVAVPFRYKGTRMPCVYRVDFVVYEIAVELKSVEKLVPLHETQILSYMRMLSLSEGLLMNFNVKRMVDGIRRFLL
jgi:GxxExxY protein